MMRQRPAPSPWATLLCALPTSKLASTRRLSPFPFPPRPSASPSITLRLRAPTAATTSARAAPRVSRQRGRREGESQEGLSPGSFPRGRRPPVQAGQARRTVRSMPRRRERAPGRTFFRLVSAAGHSWRSTLDAPSTKATAEKDFLPSRLRTRPRRPQLAAPRARRTAHPLLPPPSSLRPDTRCESAITSRARPARCAASRRTSRAVVGARGSPQSHSRGFTFV